MIRLLKPLLPKSCDEFETDLVLCAYGKISSDERAGVEAHLDACTACRARQDRLIEELATAPLDFPPQQFWDQYSREMRSKLGEIDARRRHIRWLAPLSFGGITAMAAGIVLVVALGLSLKDSLFSNPDDNQDDAMMEEVLPIVQNLEFFESMHYLEMMDQAQDGRVKSSDAQPESRPQDTVIWFANASECAAHRWNGCRSRSSGPVAPSALA